MSVYDSRKHPGRGVGFPSTNTALDLLPPNLKDPHGYYSIIGVPPWATTAEIKARLRALYRKYHPDTGSRPDTDKFQLIRNIATVLLDPDSRRKYDETPDGMRLLDAVYEAELSRMPDLTGLSDDDLTWIMQPEQPEPRKPRRNRAPRYDYLSLGQRTLDPIYANQWYRALLALAPEYSYRGVVRVMLHDNTSLAWNDSTATLMVPRSWEVNEQVARGALTLMGQKSLSCRTHDVSSYLVTADL